MTLHTTRLTLYPVTPDNLEEIHALHLLPESDRYNTMGIPENIQQTENILNQWLHLARQTPPEKYVFVIRDSSNDFIGVTGINPGREKYRKAEIWYKLHPAHWNKGYATETVRALLDFCFGELNLHRVEAGCAVENSASSKVLEKTGFRLEGRCRKNLPIRGEWVDNFEYAILEEDYR